METLLGVVLLIGSVVGLIKFNKTSASMASGAEAKAQVWAEEMHAEAAITRADNYATFKEEVKGKEVVSHDEFMDVLSGKTKLNSSES